MQHNEFGLAKRIIVGMVLGAGFGGLLRAVDLQAGLLRYIADPVGTVWLNLLLVMMLPLASSALVLGMLGLDGRQLGRIGLKTLGLTLLLTSIAVIIGLAAVYLVQPGVGIDPATLPTQPLNAPAASADPIDLLVAQFPSNVVAAAAGRNLVPVLIFAVLFGLALRVTDTAPAAAVRTLVQGIFDVSAQAIRMVLKLAPVGVACLTYEMVAKGGLAALLPVAWFTFAVLAALAVQMFVVYPLALRFLGGQDVAAFFRGARPAMLVAFSTASSAATLPTALEVAETRLGIHPETARFVLTVGATGNQNGTALFEGLAVLFLAQLYGVDLSVAQQAGVIGVAIVGGIGTAGVPGGALPVITAVILSLGLPEQAIGIIVGIDRLLDMCRTTLNVTGDLVIAAIVSEPVGD